MFPSHASLVHIDALALNKAGLPVEDLTPADFEIEFEGRKFQPRVAAYVPLVDLRGGEATRALRGEKPKAEEAQRVIVFFVVNPVLDVMEDSSDPSASLLPSLAPRTMEAARRTARLISHYVDRLAGPRDIVAIARAESRRVVLSELTTDRAVLRQAIEDVRDRWLEAPPINIAPGNVSTFDRRIAEMVDQMTGAIDSIRALPGRKLMFVSSRFLRTGRDFTRAADALRGLREAANRSAVTIYGMDPSGPAADEARAREGDKVTPLRDLAAATGGRLIANTNNLEGQVEKALDENRGYYILGFEPGPSIRDRPARIRVRALREGVEVRARETLAPDLSLRVAPGFLEGGRLAELVDSPYSPRGLGVGLDVAIRWNDSGEPELEIATTIDGAANSSVRLEVLTRILTEEHELVFGEERSMTLRPKDASRPLRFKTTRKLDQPSPNGERRQAEDGAIFQVDVAVRDVSSGASGSARRLISLTLPQKDRLVVTSPVLRDPANNDGMVASVFSLGTSLVMQIQMAGAKRSPDGLTRIEISSRFLRDGRIVRAEPPGRIEDRLPNPFNIDGRVSLAGLPPGDYELVVEITDLVAAKKAARSSPLTIR